METAIWLLTPTAFWVSLTCGSTCLVYSFLLALVPLLLFVAFSPSQLIVQWFSTVWSGPSAHLTLNPSLLWEHTHSHPSLITPEFMWLLILTLPFKTCLPHFFLAVISLQICVLQARPVIFPFKLDVPFCVSVPGGGAACSFALEAGVLRAPPLLSIPCHSPGPSEFSFQMSLWS